MEERVCILLLLVTFVHILHQHSSTAATYDIKYESPSDCSKTDPVEYFDFSQLTCWPCAPNTTVSADGLKCICQPGFKKVRDFGGAAVECQQCPTGQATSLDGWQCVLCEKGFDETTGKCISCQTTEIVTQPSLDITVEREIDGEWGLINTRTCQACASETSPNSDKTQCFRCNQVLSVLPLQSDCICPANQQVPGGLCFSSNADIVPENQELFRVRFLDDVFESAYFAQNAQMAAGMCKTPYLNLTACQQLANMCTMILYTRENEGATDKDTCALYLQYAGNTDRPQHMPWLYYNEEDGQEVLTDRGIPTQYTFPNMSLDIEAAIYSIDGLYLGYKDATGGLFQLCPASETTLNSAYKFGTFYDQSCKIRASDLWDEKKYPLYFYDPYLSYRDSNEDRIYAVPVLITNYVDDDEQVNIDADRTKWQLVRRFMLVDNVSGKRAVTDPAAVSGLIQPVRYAKNIIIHVELRADSNAGEILPPYIEITYDVATPQMYEDGDQLTLTFQVQYRMDISQHTRDIGIAVGVLGALAVAYSGVQVWGWSKRSGRIGIDFVVLCKFLIFCMGNLANVFFVVMLGSSLWWLIFYKQQKTVSMILPSKDQESQFVAFIASAFVLKFFQLLHIIICQVTVDIFFIDWERPRGQVISSNDAQQKGKDTPVSIWRTYFVANEWNEIQTTRKINHMLQIFTTILFLEVIGFGNLATTDPYSNFKRNGDNYYSNDSRIFRFAIEGMTYLLIAILQWVFFTFIYERFIEDKVRQYVDLCSLSNISVFILETGQFGYYIHGRSVHGRADTGMRDMAENLKREEENLCGQRGLVPNTVKQTFQIAVPAKLRNQYDKVLRPIYVEQATPGARSQVTTGGTGGHIDTHTDNCLRAYDILNRFLQAFIDHSLREIDYIVKDRTFLENVLNMEFMEPLEQSFFYNDSGHAFDSVLLFGHENTLIIFEILFFAIIDLFAQNYVLSGILVYLLMELIHLMRDGLGRSNLAKKTLVDKRFLI